MVIEKLRNLLYESINKKGLSAKETYTINIRLDQEIESFYTAGQINMKFYYYQTIEELKKYIRKKGCPNAEEWNRYAKANYYLCSESIQYISQLGFGSVCKQLERQRIESIT